MTFLRSLLGQALRRAASDPKLRDKTREIAQEEVAPRLAAARDELRDLAGDSHSKGFLYSLGRRIGEINRRRDED